MSSHEHSSRLRDLGLLPHQVDFVDTVLAPTATRVVLVSPPGLGKGFAVAAALSQYIGIHPEARSLVLCPSALRMMWRETLNKRFGMKSQIVDADFCRRAEAENLVNPNPWANGQVLIASDDFAKQPEQAQRILEASWQFVVYDEVHRGLGRGQRASLFESIWLSGRVSLCVALGVHEVDTARMPKDRGRQVVWSRGSIVDWDGATLMRPLSLELVTFARTPEENKLRQACQALVADDQTTQGRFLERVLIARADSSLFALEQTLRRMLARIRSIDQLLAHDLLWEDAGDPSTETLEGLISQEGLERCLALVEDVPEDRKLRAAIECIRRECEAKTDAFVAFTKFADSAYYLANALAAEGTPVVAITGEDSFDERRDKLSAARQDASGIVCTDALAEGTDLTFASRVLHFDIPDTSTKMEERIGRVYRVGQKRDVRLFALLCSDEGDSEAYSTTLFRKHMQMSTDLGG